MIRCRWVSSSADMFSPHLIVFSREQHFWKISLKHLFTFRVWWCIFLHCGSCHLLIVVKMGLSPDWLFSGCWGTGVSLFHVSSEFCAEHSSAQCTPTGFLGALHTHRWHSSLSFSFSTDFSDPVSWARAEYWELSADCRQGVLPQKHGVFGEHFAHHLGPFQWLTVSIYCSVVPQHRDSLIHSFVFLHLSVILV